MGKITREILISAISAMLITSAKELAKNLAKIIHKI